MPDGASSDKLIASVKGSKAYSQHVLAEPVVGWGGLTGLSAQGSDAAGVVRGAQGLPRRGDDSQRHGDRYGNHQGQDHQRQGRRNALCDHRDDRLPGEQRISKIALQCGEGPGVPLSEANPITLLPNPTLDVQRLLGPKQTTRGAACIYSAEQLDMIRDSGYHLYIVSTADYFDIFDKHHYTETCFELLNFSKDDKFEDVNVSPRGDVNNCGRNCADNECDKP
jgi:hypothetical protein